jgi:hypothetical protein
VHSLENGKVANNPHKQGCEECQHGKLGRITIFVGLAVVVLEPNNVDLKELLRARHLGLVAFPLEFFIQIGPRQRTDESADQVHD